jgi:DNA-binding HxlR family transcriptional regulator
MVDRKIEETWGRSGSHALGLLTTTLNVTILGQLLDGPLRLSQLHSSRVSAPQSTVRARLRSMTANGLILRRDRKEASGVADFELTAAGTELLVVVDALEQWLLLSPEGAMSMDSAGGKAAIGALDGGWASAIVGTLAAEHYSLTQLAGVIDDVNYPSLDRRLTAMRRARQVEAGALGAHGTPYKLSRWLQQSIVPIAAAVRWENTYFPAQATAVTRLDTEAALLMALPLLEMGNEMGNEMGGTCRMEVDIDDAVGRLCGAITVVERGRVVSSTAGVKGPADSWATGEVPAWALAMTGADMNGLGTGGDKPLVEGLLTGLQHVLFGAEADGPDRSALRQPSS